MSHREHEPQEDRTVCLKHLADSDGRYDVQALHFLFEALAYSQELFSKDTDSEEEEARHVTGQELCEGIRLLALEQFGFMAKAVFEGWGIYRTADFGEMVYLLIQNKLMAKRDSDSIEDFHGVYDFETAFEDAFESERKQKRSRHGPTT